MDQQKTAAQAEFAATHTVYSALEPLDADARDRVVTHIAAMLGIAAPQIRSKAIKNDTIAEDDGQAGVEEVAATTPAYKTFAELFDAAQPQTAAHKALLAGYWLQVCAGAESFDGQSANRELNHLGHRIANITNALASLNTQKPSLAIQLKKSGTTQQARKTYKITNAGEAAVKAMLNG